MPVKNPRYETTIYATAEETVMGGAGIKGGEVVQPQQHGSQRKLPIRGAECKRLTGTRKMDGGWGDGGMMLRRAICTAG